MFRTILCFFLSLSCLALAGCGKEAPAPVMFMAMFSADLNPEVAADAVLVVALPVVSVVAAALLLVSAAGSVVSVDLLHAVSTKVQLTATANNE